MKYLAVQLANCEEGPFRPTVARLKADLENNYPIVVRVKEVELKEGVDFENAKVLK